MSALFSETKIQLKSDTLSDQVYSYLLEGIVSMRIKPSTVMKEEDVAESLGVSRAPVREALLHLEEVGFITKSRKGRLVTPITKEVIVENYRYLEMTESYGTALACQLATEEDLEIIRGHLKRLEECDVNDYRKENEKYHRALVAPCRVKKIIQAHNEARHLVNWTTNYTLCSKEKTDASMGRHRAVYDAYVARDKDLLIHLVQKNVRIVEEQLLSSYFSRQDELHR